MSKPSETEDESNRRVRELTDELELTRSELARLEAALDAARRFGAEQARLAVQRTTEVNELRATKTFVYTAPFRRIYGRCRRLVGRLWRQP